MQIAVIIVGKINQDIKNVIKRNLVIFVDL